MSPTLRPPEEVRLKRTGMSTRELRRAEVLARVKSQTLRLVDAAKMLELSYRQTKRLWKRYRGEGVKGLQHRSAGRDSNRAKPEKFRRKVLQLIREKYSGTEQERFGAVEVRYRGERMEYEDLAVRPPVVPAAPRAPRRKPAKEVGSKPALEHPWRQGYEQRMKLQRLNRSQESALLGVTACATP